MINYGCEALYDSKYLVWDKAFANLCKYERDHELTGKIFWITDEYCRLSDLENSARKELDEARKKFFGSI